mmetsp:Transcript_119590/g.298246  ORF Transcript_119590/g.298246 Transcript_119590/m.298246 type:complete len:338 (-) Transcript_119590:904-1917(-)
MPTPPLISRARYENHSELCCSKRNALICSAHSCPPSPMRSATRCKVLVAWSRTAGLFERAKRMTQGANCVSERTISRTSSKVRRHWKVNNNCTTISSSSRFSTRTCCKRLGSRELATYWADSNINPKLPTSITHSRTMSSSEKPGTSNLVSKSMRPASQSSPQGMSSSVTLTRMPRTSANKSGLSTQPGAMRTNSCIHFDMRTLSPCSTSIICSRTPLCMEQWRISLQSKGSLVLSTRSITCGKRPLPTITSAARGCVDKFTTRATRSVPTRGCGKWTTNCKSMVMPSGWNAISDLHLSSMEKWYKSRRTMCRKCGIRRRSTKSLTMPDSIRELRKA